jgi:dihydrofolate synthase/folylpolyglutamate synthase
MTYPEALRYLESFIDYEKITAWPYEESLGLGRIRDFLSALNNPQDGLNCLHVAGTKGKGSTCALLSYVLRQAGYKVGLYTSPHLSDFRERIRILNGRVRSAQGQKDKKDFAGLISKNELTDLVSRLKPAIEKYNKDSKYGPLTFFEAYTALALVYFKEKKTDFLVLETGLGGRLDATNVVEPLVCAITPISYEHTQRLGNTLRKIATEKAGIIKIHRAGKSSSRQAIVITAPQKDEAQGVIRQRCKELKVNLYEVGKDIVFKETSRGFSIDGIFGKYPDLKVGLLGKHQLVNAAVAVGVIAALKFHGITIDIVSIRRGLARAVWPGRCEVIAKDPWVVLDGAQNIASAQALRQAIKENFSRGNRLKQSRKFEKLILVFGISKDKDIRGTSSELADLADTVVLTKSCNPRAQQPEALLEYFQDRPAYITQGVKEAQELVKGIAARKDLVLVTGSLFVVGEFRNGKPTLL